MVVADGKVEGRRERKAREERRRSLREGNMGGEEKVSVQRERERERQRLKKKMTAVEIGRRIQLAAALSLAVPCKLRELGVCVVITDFILCLVRCPTPRQLSC
ncbi:hypothetical protein ACJRO7_003207 [Eucalyptus globulus]|uniref:Uncharacterized protein n=1 Tax=Eucalyptus globulus TaxID=34317 RepID=A0ABD3IU13_EUCGL